MKLLRRLFVLIPLCIVMVAEGLPRRSTLGFIMYFVGSMSCIGLIIKTAFELVEGEHPQLRAFLRWL